jgi:SAM-dependent methyltransferase
MNEVLATSSTMSKRNGEIRRLHDDFGPQRAIWLRKGAFFHAEDLRYLKFLIPEGHRILELGCGTGHLLAALNPSLGVGIDFSDAMIAEAGKAHPDLLVGDIEDEAFVRSLGGPFDVILIVDTIGSLDDCQRAFKILHPLFYSRDATHHRVFLSSLASSA